MLLVVCRSLRQTLDLSVWVHWECWNGFDQSTVCLSLIARQARPNASFSAAHIWVDGRYWQQVESEVDHNVCLGNAISLPSDLLPVDRHESWLAEDTFLD